MAELQTQGNVPGKRRFKRLSPRMDMTPMVDLAFLLLTFFVLTATFQVPKSMEITFPSEGEPTHLRRGITFLLGTNDRIFYYEGELQTNESGARKKTQLVELSFQPQRRNSLRGFLLDKSASLHQDLKKLSLKRNKKELDEKTFKHLSREAKANKEQYTFLVKACKNASYKNVVDLLDELNICLIGKYTLCDPHPAEEKLLEEQLQVASLK